MTDTMDNKQGLIIFAVNTTEDEREVRNLKATLRYNGLTPDALVVAERCYKGEQEQSYVYPFNFHAWDTIRDLCCAHEQETILHVHPNWACLLRVLPSNEAVYLGVFTGVSCAGARMMRTYVRIMNQYYYINQGE